MKTARRARSYTIVTVALWRGPRSMPGRRRVPCESPGGLPLLDIPRPRVKAITPGSRWSPSRNQRPGRRLVGRMLDLVPSRR